MEDSPKPVGGISEDGVIRILQEVRQIQREAGNIALRGAGVDVLGEVEEPTPMQKALAGLVDTFGSRTAGTVADMLKDGWDVARAHLKAKLMPGKSGKSTKESEASNGHEVVAPGE